MMIWAFYTDDAVYRPKADALRESLVALGYTEGVDFEIEQVTPAANSADTIKQRPALIKAAIDRHNEPVLAVDCDCIFHQEVPAMPAGDIVGRTVPEPTSTDAKKWMYAGVLYLANTQGAKDFLDSWAELCSGDRIEQDSGLLQEVWPNFNTAELPDGMLHAPYLKHNDNANGIVIEVTQSEV